MVIYYIVLYIARLIANYFATFLRLIENIPNIFLWNLSINYIFRLIALFIFFIWHLYFDYLSNYLIVLFHCFYQFLMAVYCIVIYIALLVIIFHTKNLHHFYLLLIIYFGLFYFSQILNQISLHQIPHYPWYNFLHLLYHLLFVTLLIF